ncbi:chemotaxis protein CheW [Castellaniella hirudinis]|uniref:Chemotaxis protein CheW n=1 Tax=Castellaniella hirudinis TaxID=1144617 RepID=A0ABV8RZ09_9BURK
MKGYEGNHENNQDRQGPKTREYLVFELVGQEYGIDILKVQEIRGYDAKMVAPIADAPAHVRGVMNLRGAIVPIVDLCAKLGIERAVYDERTVVVVLGLGARRVGIVVNGVSDVTELPPSQIKDPPRFGTDASSRFVTGIGTVDQRMLILVDIEALLEDDPSLDAGVQTRDRQGQGAMQGQAGRADVRP